MRLTSLLPAVLLSCASAQPPPVPNAAPDALPAAQPKAEQQPEVPPFRYRVAGPAGAPALVLVHGNFDNLETWDAVVPALSRSFRVVTLDLLGYGESPSALGSFTSTVWAEQVRQLLDGLGIERAVLVGNSMAGTVIARFASSWPERTAGLVFEDANLNATFGEPRADGPMKSLVEAAQALAAAPADPAPRQALREAVGAVLRVALRPEHVTEALVDHFAKGFDPPHFESLQRQRTFMEYQQLPAALMAAQAKVPFPVLALWGLDDPLVPLEGAETLRQQLPASRLEIFAECGHAPHLERPARFVAAIEAAFGPGGALPADDLFVPGDGPAPTPPDPQDSRLADWPRTRLTLYRHLQATDPSPERAVGIAEACLDLGDLHCARSNLPDAADAAVLAAPVQARRLYVEGVLRELGNDSAGAAEQLTKALEAQPDFDSSPRYLALARLAGLPLFSFQARVVDGRLFPAPADGATEPAELTEARIDRLNSLERYQEALAELERHPKLQPGPRGRLRQGRALFGLGRFDEAVTVLKTLPGQLGRNLRSGAPHTDSARRTEAMMGCVQPLLWAAQLEAGLGAQLGQVRCEPPATRLDGWPSDRQSVRDQLRLESLTAGGDALRARLSEHSVTPWGAQAWAELDLREGQPARARAALKAVPPAATAQAPGFARLALGLRAEAGERSALPEARRLAAAHPGSAPWEEVLAVTLLASGKAAEGRELLQRLVESRPGARWLRLELAAALALTGDLPGARAAREAAGSPCPDCQLLAPRFAYQRKAEKLMAAR